MSFRYRSRHTATKPPHLLPDIGITIGQMPFVVREKGVPPLGIPPVVPFHKDCGIPLPHKIPQHRSSPWY